MIEGYATLQQVVNEYKLYLYAKMCAPERLQGESVASYIQGRISARLKMATPRLRKFIQKNDIKKYDFYLLAVQALTRRCKGLDDFLDGMIDSGSSHEKIAKILTSVAFKKGMLKSLLPLLPKKINTKVDLLNFVRSRNGVSTMELQAIATHYVGRRWKRWMREAESKREVQRTRGEWYA